MLSFCVWAHWNALHEWFCNLLIKVECLCQVWCVLELNAFLNMFAGEEEYILKGLVLLQHSSLTNIGKDLLNYLFTCCYNWFMCVLRCINLFQYYVFIYLLLLKKSMGGILCYANDALKLLSSSLIQIMNKFDSFSLSVQAVQFSDDSVNQIIAVNCSGHFILMLFSVSSQVFWAGLALYISGVTPNLVVCFNFFYSMHWAIYVKCFRVTLFSYSNKVWTPSLFLFLLRIYIISLFLYDYD